MSLIKTGILRSEIDKEKISLANKGRIFSDIHKAKISIAKMGVNNPVSKKVYVYSNENPFILFKSFNSYTEAGKYFNCSRMTISRYIDTKNLYKKNWILLSIKGD